MANYGVANSTTGGAGTVAAVLASSTSYVTQLAVAASSGGLSPPVNFGIRRGKVYDILVGTAGTPADSYIEYECIRATVGTTMVWLGSISSVSSGYPLDMADTGFSAFVTMNASAETNIAAVLGQAWYVGVNQRASYRWVAAPGSEIVYPAVSSGVSGGGNGLALKARGTATVAVSANIMFQEQ